MLVQVGRVLFNPEFLVHATVSRDSLVLEFVGGRALVLYAEQAQTALATLLALRRHVIVRESDEIAAQELLASAPDDECDDEVWEESDE